MRHPDKSKPDTPDPDSVASAAQIRVAAIRRARQASRERQDEAAAAEQERMGAFRRRIQQADEARREREEEEKAIADDAARRNTDPETERVLMAQQRLAEAEAVRAEEAKEVEAGRASAIRSAVKHATETRQRRTVEAEAAADPAGTEFQEEMQRRAAMASRLQQNRAEREASEAEAHRDHEAAVAHLARQARQARAERERGDAAMAEVDLRADQEAVKRLAAMMSSKPDTERWRKQAEQPRQRPAAPAAPEAPPDAQPDEARRPIRDLAFGWLARIIRRGGPATSAPREAEKAEVPDR